MTVAAHALTMASDLETLLGLDNTSPKYASQIARIEALINAVSDEMRRAAGRDFHRIVNRIETVRHPGGPYLFVGHAPIVSVASVSQIDVDGSILTTYVSTEYRVASEIGAIWCSDWASSAPLDGVAMKPRTGLELPTYRVTYTSGWITAWQANVSYPGGSLGTRDLPYSLEEACKRAVEVNWYRSGPDYDNVSRGDQNFSFRNRRIGLLPEDVYDLCRSYQRSL